MGKAEGKKLSDFVRTLNGQDWSEINQLKGEVEGFATSFPTIGF